MGIEQTIHSAGLPYNSYCMLNRLRELLEENGSNCLSDEKQRSDPRIKAVLWLINSQVYGQLAKIDLMAEYGKITKALSEQV